jgi:hypothetical protein
MDDSKIERMRERAQRMRRAASLSHDPQIIAILSKAAGEADADAAEMEAELGRQIEHLPPQT